MKLQDFLNLPPGHTISFEDGRELHRDIALNGAVGLTEEQSRLLQEYLNACLLYQSVDPSLKKKLEAIHEELNEHNSGKCPR